MLDFLIVGIGASAGGLEAMEDVTGPGRKAEIACVEKGNVMAKKPDGSTTFTGLRQQAEELLRGTTREVAAIPVKDVQQLVHELHAHQVELEMQNEELRRAQVELASTRDRYLDLYDYSPVGYLTLNRSGTVVEANLLVGELLGVNRQELIGQSLAHFVTRDDEDTFHRHAQEVLKTGTRQTCEVQFQKNSGEARSVYLLQSLAVHEESGGLAHWRTVLFDVTDRKKVEVTLSRSHEALEQRVAEQTANLVKSNERFEWVVKATHDGLWDWDLIHDTAYFSPHWRRMHGFQETDNEESSEEWSERIHPDDRPQVMAHLHAYWQKERTEFWEEYRIRRKDGTLMWVLDRGVAQWDGQGRPVRMLGSETDITWRKAAEEAVHRRAHEFQMLADNVPSFFCYIDRDRRYKFVNRQYEDFFCRPAKEIIGMTMHELLGPGGYAEVQPHVDVALGGQAESFVYCLLLSDGHEKWFGAQYLPDRDQQGNIAGLFILLTDITAFKVIEEALRERERQLESLSARLLQSQEEERRRIARELHDDFTQRLAALTIDLRTVRLASPGSDSLSVSQLQRLGDVVEQLATDLQQMAHRLHPSILEHVGLEVAVREQLAEFAARTGISTEAMVRDLPNAVPLEQALCIYRVLQESLQNIRKHADAKNVLVRLLKIGHGVGLCVHDDGRGFEQAQRVTNRHSLGLTSMEERVKLYQGTFRIRTQPGNGTEVHVWVPLEDVKREA
ncbi:MAG: PAS domain S-box protein [Nitrospiraceae bacterium]